MKIIFSRKGFDSGYGGVPSPIFPDGRFVSLPIPSPAGSPAGLCIADELNIGNIASDLTLGRINGQTLLHVDPDLTTSTLSRKPGWRPGFGQVGAAQAHLSNQGVGVGDLFLFFGWFRSVEFRSAKWHYVTADSGFHSLFGWLQVGQILDVDAIGVQNLPDWISSHPHVAHAERFTGQNNTIYLATDELSLAVGEDQVHGGGSFSNWSEALKLTAQGKSRSIWRVPNWLEPRGRPPLTYHSSPTRWTHESGELHLQTVAKGQEFILDAVHYPEAASWACDLIQGHL